MSKFFLSVVCCISLGGSLCLAQEEVDKEKVLDGVEVSQQVIKAQSCNPLSLMGVRRMTVEETQRIAGSFEDPMRTAALTPGVNSQVGDNGISIHGNPPFSIRYHIEGAEIPSPNHFADAMGYGGAFCSSMKVTMLTDWDLFSSAPTAEYGNTLGGVLDYHLRMGNTQAQKFTLKAGVLGLEALAEGPMGKNGASYMVDYRYALTSLAYDMGMILLNDEMFDFQDFSFKLQFPTHRGGSFSLWGQGQLDDHYWSLTYLGEEAETVEDLHAQDCRQHLLMGGANLDQPLPRNWRLRLTAVASTFYNHNSDSYYTHPYAATDVMLFNDRQRTEQYTFSASLQHRLNRYVLMKFGGQYTQYVHRYLFAERERLDLSLPMVVRQDDRNTLGLGHLYAEAVADAGRWHFNMGVATEGLTNATSWSVEPRMGVLWQFATQQSLSLGVARSQQMPSLDNIFYRDAQFAGLGDGEKLRMMGSNQLILTYRWQRRPDFSLIAEAYCDRLDHLPVGVNDVTYCLFNRYLFNQSQPLVSAGKGRSYGLTLGLDQYMRNGVYYMANAMLFNNEWMGLDGVWRNTRQNRRWKLSGALGKEWKFGRDKDRAFNTNVSFNLMGGLFDTPVLLDKTRQNYKNGIPYVVYDTSRALTRQYDMVPLLNVSATYRINSSKRFSQLIGFEWMNVLMQGEPWTQRYDFIHDKVVDIETVTSLPNLYYQIDF